MNFLIKFVQLVERGNIMNQVSLFFIINHQNASYINPNLHKQCHNYMTPEEYQKFKRQLKETQQRGQQMLARIDKTLEGVQDTIQQIHENEEKIDNFKNQFANVMTKLAQKIAGSLAANPFKKVEGRKYEHFPVKKPVLEVVKKMMEYKDILIITGAGVSAPSGIPTFRGVNGLYSKKFKWQDEEIQPQAFITKAFYEKHPQGIWQWIEQIYQMANTLKHNKIHILIDQLAKVLNIKGKKVTLITQNIDDFHLKPAKEEYRYSAVHGNVKQIRCDNNHIHKYADYRKSIFVQKKQVKCPKCQLPLRPHVLFFDQSYGPLYGEDVKDDSYPFVMVIGSSLSTGLCARLALNGKEVVQINPSPVIEVGKVYQFAEDTVETLSGFMRELGEKKK